ncbi:hypothetical protein [Fundidesulfovibrio terrae]|uniref:hypothetical protein n=1 Tax=Fundidesulfovibrio terrae TaxID=2922866 RepID=UPI001FAFA7D6|nr:hypothetical protein [Fundidesulfovibrio terrae]
MIMDHTKSGPAEPAIPASRWLVALAASAAVFCLAHWKSLASPLVINDDLRQQIFWMQRWLDPALYPPDLLNAYSEAYVPWGVKFLYWCGSWFMNPLQFSKVVTGALYCAQCLLLMGLGRRLGGRDAGWAALAAGWLMPFFLDNMAGGLSRAFASPLLAAFALAWLLGSGTWLGRVLAAQALFIPYIFLPCALAVTAQKAWSHVKGRPGVWLNTRRHWIVLVASAAAVLAFTQVYAMKGFGPLVSLAETAGRPEFGPKGRLDLAPLPNPFLDFVYFPFEGIGLFKELTLIPGILSLCLLAWPLWKGAGQLPWRELARRAKPLAWIGGSFLLFYVMARARAFALFVPDRYVQYPINLFYALLLSACLRAAWRARRAWTGKGATVALLAVLAVAGGVRLMGVGLYDLRPDKALYDGVEAATPKDALVAGHPDLMDNVQTFAKRNGFVNTELAQPWSVGYWNQIRPRLDGLFAAYYAEDAADVAAFAKHFGVDFLLVDESHFTREFLTRDPFFEPFGQAIRDMTRDRTHFAVLDQSRFARIPLRPGAFLIDLRPYSRG